MANQVIVTANNTVQVAIEPTPNVEVTISRTAIGTVANVQSANYANYAGTVTNAAQPNITSVGNLTVLNVDGIATVDNLVVNGNLQIGNLTANNANYANFAGEAYSITAANVTGLGNIATVNLDGDSANVLYGNGVFAPAAGGGNVTNANYANFAGTAYSVSGSIS